MIGCMSVVVGLLSLGLPPDADESKAGFHNPSSIRTIYVVPMSHLDIGFTDTPDAVARGCVEAIDEAMEAAANDPEYIWTVETFWQLQQWLDQPERNRNEARLVELIRAGRIGMGAAFVSPHPFVMGWPSLSRLCDPAKTWAATHGIPTGVAVLNDVAGYPADLPAALAGQGIRYLLLGVNQAFTDRLPASLCDAPFWWEAPTGERVLTFIACDSYTAAYTRLGIDPATAGVFAPDRFGKLEPMARMEKGIGQELRKLGEKGYPYDAYVTIHAFDNWGSRTARRVPKATKDWNQRHGDTVRLKTATPAEFFQQIERRYGEGLPVRRGGFGGEWDTLRNGIPTTMKRLQAAEQQLARGENPEPHLLRNVLTGFGHTNGLGPGWPKLLTLAQTIEHNRWWSRLAQTYPMPPSPDGPETPVQIPLAPEELVQSNVLYLGHMFLYHFGLGEQPTPLDRNVWTPLPPAQREDGIIRLRHRIDRRKLPDQKPVVWAWRLSPEELWAKPRVELASGRWVTLPDDDLRRDQPPELWVSARRMQLGRTTIAANTILTFARKRARPGVLLALCLRQARDSVLKDGSRHRLTFAEAYPGEEPIFELIIDVERSP